MAGGVADEGVLRKLLQQMNSQVPSKRPRLTELVSMPDPHYEGRDGCRYVVDRRELELIGNALRSRDLLDVKLPIILMADTSHEQSTWRVEGEEECAVVSELLKRNDGDTRTRLFLYAPHIAELRRKLPTTIVCMFIP